MDSSSCNPKRHACSFTTESFLRRPSFPTRINKTEFVFLKRTLTVSAPGLTPCPPIRSCRLHRVTLGQVTSCPVLPRWRLGWGAGGDPRRQRRRHELLLSLGHAVLAGITSERHQVSAAKVSSKFRLIPPRPELDPHRQSASFPASQSQRSGAPPATYCALGPQIPPSCSLPAPWVVTASWALVFTFSGLPVPSLLSFSTPAVV